MITTILSIYIRLYYANIPMCVYISQISTTENQEYNRQKTQQMHIESSKLTSPWLNMNYAEIQTHFSSAPSLLQNYQQCYNFHLNIITMKNKINQLEDQLSRSILEEQLLKSQNSMLTKQLQRLKRLKQKNNEYSTKTDHMIRQRQYRQALKKKHEKSMNVLNLKVQNCKYTIIKLKSLIGVFEEGELESKENRSFSMNLTRVQKEENIYSEVKCEDCGSVMPPCQYFLHLQNKQCPFKHL